MSHLTWSSELDTGISEIDQQHKQIMVLINRLQDARDSGDREGILAVVNDLVDYTVSHLDFEESMLEKVQYEFLGGHKKVHTLLVRNVKGIQQRIQAGEDVVHELHSLLHRWLLNHILHDDAAYVRVVRPKAQELVEDKAEGGWLSRALGSFFRKANA